MDTACPYFTHSFGSRFGLTYKDAPHGVLVDWTFTPRVQVGYN